MSTATRTRPALDLDQELQKLARRDKDLGRAMKLLPAFPRFPLAEERRRSHYESLARAIVYQQVTGKAAATIFGRVCALTPGPRFPKAEDIAGLSDDQLRGAGLSRGKLLAIRDLAERVASGRLPLRSIDRQPDDEVIARLVEVRGIGVWSAQMFLLFKLGRLDVLPVGDLGVQEGLKVLHGLTDRPTPAVVEERGARWRPLASVGAWFCWRAHEGFKAGTFSPGRRGR